MVAGHFVLLAALFVQPPPETAVLHENVLDTHGERRADPRARIDHQPVSRALAHTRRPTHVDRLMQPPRLVGGQPRPPLGHPPCRARWRPYVSILLSVGPFIKNKTLTFHVQQI